MRHWFLLAFLLPSASLAQKTDTIRLFKGDLIVGEMKDLKLGLLRVSTDYMSTVYIEWDQIQTVRTNKRWDIRTDNGAHFVGYLAPSAQLDHVSIRLEENDSVHINLIDIVSLYRVNKSIWSRMDGNLSVGFSYQASNQITQLSGSGNATYRYARGAMNFSFNSITTTQTEVEDNRKQDISLGWERNLWNDWIASLSGGAESNTELDLDLRLKANLALGNYILNTVHSTDVLGGGLQANHESSGGGEANDNLELFAGNRLRIKTYRFPEIMLYIDLVGYYGLTIRDRYRLSGEVEFAYEVFKDFTVGLEFYEQYDSKPLDGGPDLNDYRIAATVGYTF